MQKLLFLLAFVCLSAASISAQNATKVEVYFQQYHTKDMLMNIKAEMASMNVALEYTHMAFDNTGHLTELSFNVDFKDGFKGEASSVSIPKGAVFGFVRDYRKGAEVAFQAGNLLEKDK
ncbi:MAG: hypothetical protein ACKVU2_04990 [Saprospiraceae bacterium]